MKFNLDKVSFQGIDLSKVHLSGDNLIPQPDGSYKEVVWDEETKTWVSLTHWDKASALASHLQRMQIIREELENDKREFRLIASVPVHELREWMHQERKGLPNGVDLACTDYNDMLKRFFKERPEWKVNPRENLPDRLFKEPTGESEAIDGLHNTRRLDKEMYGMNEEGENPVGDEIVGNIAEEMRSLLSRIGNKRKNRTVTAIFKGANDNG